MGITTEIEDKNENCSGSSDSSSDDANVLKIRLVARNSGNGAARAKHDFDNDDGIKAGRNENN
jgi:hypothetical protein